MYFLCDCVFLLTCALTVIPRSLSTFNLSNTCLFDPVFEIVFVNSNNLFKILAQISSYISALFFSNLSANVLFP